MAPFDPIPFPLVAMQAVANAQKEWVALTVHLDPAHVDTSAGLHAVFGDSAMLAAIAPLDCVVFVATPTILTKSLLSLLPPNRVIFAFRAIAFADQAASDCAVALHGQGYRILLDGPVPPGIQVPANLRAIALDCSATRPIPGPMPVLAGPHLARRVDSTACFDLCERAGFEWFTGDYALNPPPSAEHSDGTSRRRLLALLGLVARDAESRELETLLKQDPALSYHLLKLVNSAAFALSTPITSFGQAIGLLGRRQLQRWLQLLLYARGQEDGPHNPLLPVAALRAAQMEALCKVRGGDREAQDVAFMTGVFSLLDLLLAMPMSDIVGALSLAPGAAEALLTREGPLGELLTLVEMSTPDLRQLQSAAIEPRQWWESQLHAYHWAIQVSRNL
jgi:EAL and modified HD-GYP domain-containing signal transduction protein